MSESKSSALESISNPEQVKVYCMGLKTEVLSGLVFFFFIFT